MSNTEVHLTIRGDGFDAKRFFEALPSPIQGEVGILKSWKAGMPLNRKYYWNSQERFITSPGLLENSILDLVARYGSFIAGLSGNSLDISLDIVTHFENPEDVHGFNFSSATLKVLCQYGIALDLDSYCYSETQMGANSHGEM